jgi:hypothetical protein
LKIPKRNWQRLRDSDLVSLPLHPNLVGRQERCLWFSSPPKIPGWGLVIRSSHSREWCAWHLVGKLCLRDLNRSEKEVLKLLGATLDESWYLIVNFLLERRFDTNLVTRFEKRRFWDTFNFHFFPTVKDPIQRFASFEPSLSLSRVWVSGKTLPPVRFIGVGYKDHGTLSTLPSWKEQLVDENWDQPNLSKIQITHRFLLGLLPPRVFGDPPS